MEGAADAVELSPADLEDLQKAKKNILLAYNGGRITYSSSNRSYTNRLMATYSSGLDDKGWAYSISMGRRWGDEGYQDASFYDSNSLFVSVEKILNDKHSLNLAAIYAPN